MKNLLLACVFASSIFAVTTHVRAAENTLIFPEPNEPKTLSPNFVADIGTYHASSNIYSHLVAMDWGVTGGTAAYGDLAESWKYSDDLKTITFKLHSGVKWHDGKPLTSADVMFTYNRMIEKKYPYAAYLKNIQTIEAPDPLTVVFNLKNPDVSIVPMMAQAAGWTGKIYPKHLWESQPGFDTGPYVNKPIGSGPFKFVSWDKGGSIELGANKDYFRAPPKLDRLIFQYISEPNVARAEFDAGTFPILPYNFAPTFAEVAALQKDPSVKVIVTPSHYSRDIQFNLKRAPLDQIDVRRAISMAIDRESIQRIAFSGLWPAEYHANVNAMVEWVNKDVSFPRFDPAKAEAMLDAAGLPRKANGWRFPLKLTGPSYVDCIGINNVLVQQLRAVGIEATIEQFDQATWFTRMNEKKFDISCYFTRYGPDPDAYREHFGTGGPRNFMGFSNAEFDNLGAQAVTIADKAERKKLYDRMQAILVEEVPYVTLVAQAEHVLERPGWTGYAKDPDGYNKSLTWFGFYAVTPPTK